jgi:hypothetical protein
MMNQQNMMSGNMDNIFLLSAMKENTSIYQLIGGYVIMYCVQNIVHIKRWAYHVHIIYILPVMFISYGEGYEEIENGVVI